MVPNFWCSCYLIFQRAHPSSRQSKYLAVNWRVLAWAPLARKPRHCHYLIQLQSPLEYHSNSSLSRLAKSSPSFEAIRYHTIGLYPNPLPGIDPEGSYYGPFRRFVVQLTSSASWSSQRRSFYWQRLTHES